MPSHSYPSAPPFLKACKQALSMVSESLEEPVKIYNDCLKHLGQLYAVLTDFIFFFSIFPAKQRHFSALLPHIG